MREINGVLIVWSVAVILALNLRPAWPRWLRVSVGVAAMAVLVTTFFWSVRAPIGRDLEVGLGTGGTLLMIVLGLIGVVRARRQKRKADDRA